MNTQTILIIDDEPEIRRVLRKFLCLYDFSVLEAGDGEEALAVLADENPDAILCDLNMPGMSGFELLEAMRNACPEIPVFVMSGSVGKKDIAESIALGARAYFSKPFDDLSTLAQTLHLHIDEARQS